MKFMYFNDRSVPVVIRTQHDDAMHTNIEVIVPPQTLKTITITCKPYHILFLKEWDNNVLFASFIKEE
jgi:hypothetical protein